MKDYHSPLQPNEAYHIFNHANGFENLFVKQENYPFFLKKYLQFVHPIVKTYAYCLLPNHFHFLISVKSEAELLSFWKTAITEKKEARLFKVAKLNPRDFENLEDLEIELDYSALISLQFQKLFLSYSKAFNKQQNRKGSLFIPNFKRKIILNETYFYRVLRYIHQNPVRHGLVEGLLDWSHSSLFAYLEEKNTQISRKEILDWFSSKRGESKRLLWDFHQDEIFGASLDLEI